MFKADLYGKAFAAPDSVAHTCKPSTYDMEAGGSRVQDHPQLHRQIEIILAYMRLSLKTKKEYQATEVVSRAGEMAQQFGDQQLLFQMTQVQLSAPTWCLQPL